MDALTHTLAGLVMWRGGLAPRAAGAAGAAALLVAANIPDAEQVLGLAGAAVYIRNHHGALHSLVGGVVMALAVAALATLAAARSSAPPFSALFWALARSALTGWSCHLALDLFHGYGERLLWPFTEARYGMALMASFDVTNLALLLLALAVPPLLNLVNSEIGARRVNSARGALIGLALLAAAVPIRYALHGRADMAAASALVEDQESHVVRPSPFLPWRWYLVQDTPISYLTQEVDAAGERVLPGMARFRKPIPNNLLNAATEAAAGRAFLDLATYPLYSMEEGRHGVLVRIRDMQFFVPGAGERPFSVEVEVNSQMRVLTDRAYF